MYGRITTILDNAENNALRCSVLVTRADTEYNLNGRRYTRSSVQKYVQNMQDRINKRLAIVYYRHPSEVKNVRTGEIVGFDYTQNPSVAFIESMSFDPATNEVWAVIQFYNDPVSQWLADRIRQGELLPVSLRAIGQCEETAIDDDGNVKSDCSITFGDGFDILEPEDGDIPAMSDAGIKAILDHWRAEDASKREVCLIDSIANQSLIAEGRMINEKIKDLFDLGLTWPQVAKILSWDGLSASDLEAAAAFFVSLQGETPPQETATVEPQEASSEPEIAEPQETEELETAEAAEPNTENSVEIEVERSVATEIKTGAETGAESESESEQSTSEDPEAVELPEPPSKTPPEKDGELVDTSVTTCDKCGKIRRMNDASCCLRDAVSNIKCINTTNNGAKSNMAIPVTDTVLQAKLAALDELVKEREEAKQLKEYQALIDQKVNAVPDATEDEKAYLRSLALEHNDRSVGIAILDHEIKKLVDSKQNQAVVDSRLKAMGYTPKLGAKGSTIQVGTPAKPYMAVLDKLDQAIESTLSATTIADGVSGQALIKQRKAQKDLLRNSKVFNEYMEQYEAKHYKALCDAVTSSDVHSALTAQNRETLLNLAIVREEFFMSSVIESIVQPLMPNSEFKRNFVGGGNTASQADLGGVFVLPMEKVSESSRGKAKFYHTDRNVGAVELVNVNIEYSVFATRARRAAAIVDYENYAQLLTGAMNLDLLKSISIQTGAALARSIDSECIFTMLNDSREHEAVQKLNENPVASEWYFNAGGGVQGYGSNVVGVAYLLGSHAAGTLEKSTPAGVNKSPILVYPRTKTYVNGLTGATVDYIPFDITMTLPLATTPVLGYLDPVDLQIKALVEGQVPTHAVDPMNGALLFTAASNVTLLALPTNITYWYATNYSTWSKSQGLWDPVTASYVNPFPSGTELHKKARAFVEQISEFAGELYQERFRYPDFALQRFGFGNGYTAKASTFEKQVSPTDAILIEGYGAGSVIGQDAGIVHVKTANPEMPSTVLLGQRGATFFGLAHIYGMRNQNVDIAPSGGGIVQPGNGEYFMWGQLDAVGTPRFSDGRNFPYYEVVIID